MPALRHQTLPRELQENFDQLAKLLDGKLDASLVSSFVKTLLDDANARAVLATLGIAFGADTCTWSASVTSASKTVAHGLAGTPAVVLLTGIDASNLTYLGFTLTATNFQVVGREINNVSRSGTNVFHWLAIL